MILRFFADIEYEICLKFCMSTSFLKNIDILMLSLNFFKLNLNNLTCFVNIFWIFFWKIFLNNHSRSNLLCRRNRLTRLQKNWSIFQFRKSIRFFRKKRLRDKNSLKTYSTFREKLNVLIIDFYKFLRSLFRNLSLKLNFKCWILMRESQLNKIQIQNRFVELIQINNCWSRYGDKFLSIWSYIQLIKVDFLAKGGGAVAIYCVGFG